MTSTKLDLSYLSTMAAGDTDTMRTLLEALVEELKNDLPRARKLYNAKNWEMLERFCHHFKSTVSFSGDNTLINANLALWEIAHAAADTDQKGPGILQQMERQGKAVVQEVSRILKS